MTEKSAAPTLVYGKDKFGKEILLKEGSLQVMMEWERPYMEACIEKLQPKGDVLEIGFGLGYSAAAIQKHHPRSHTIIECDPGVIQKAQEWAKQFSHVKIVSGMWQDVLHTLGTFDSIFFDDYSPFSKKDIQQMQQASQRAGVTVEEIQELRESVQGTLKQFEGIAFSDEDLHIFGAEMLLRQDVELQDVINFVYSLVVSKNITSAQAEKFIAEFKAKSSSRQEEVSTAHLMELSSELMEDRFITFVEACLDSHMKKGSRLSSFISSPEATKKPEFVEKILSRDDVSFTETMMHVDVPPNCDYYKGDQAAIIVIEKLGE